jgi:hypothetical protein
MNRTPSQSATRRLRNLAITILFFGTLLPGALAGEHAKWSWSSELPKEVATTAPAANRTPAAVDRLFHHDSSPPSINSVTAVLGRPDGFSRQGLYSLTQGTAQPQKAGGTLRFLLAAAGGELHIRTGDFHLIYEAIRYDKSGRGNLLTK